MISAMKNKINAAQTNLYIQLLYLESKTNRKIYNKNHLKIKNITPIPAGGLTLTTPDSGTYKTAIINMDPARHTYLQFEVDAGHDVGLVLAAGNGANLFQFEHYIVELGRHGNREVSRSLEMI